MDFGHRRCLVADRDPSVRETIADLLRAEGAEVHEATSWPGALCLLSRLAVDAVLVDSEAIRAGGDPLPNGTPVILLCSSGNASDLPGAFGRLAKPFKRSELLGMVEQALRGAGGDSLPDGA